MEQRPTKQVIVIRTDLNMRKGKMVAQGCHASLAFMANSSIRDLMSDEQVVAWFSGPWVKICLGIGSEAELIDIHARSEDMGLRSHLITDAGLTEFKGIPTMTCVGIGPNFSDSIDKITGDLRLL